MKIAVIGGAGYIGSHVVKELQISGFTPVVFDNFSTGLKENVDSLNVEFVEGDILNKKQLDNFFTKHKVEAVIHLAALKAAGESMIEVEKYSENNISGTINLLNAMSNHKIRYIVFSSSAAVYGEPEYLPIDEKHPTNPLNYYGFTKKVIEDILFWYSKLKNIKYVSLRYFNAAGYDIDGEIRGKEKNPQNLFPIIMEVANKTRDSLTIFGDDYDTKDGTCMRDYIHVTDLAKAHIKALEYLKEKNQSEVFNLGTGETFSVKQCIEETKKITGEFKTIVGLRRPGDPPILYSDNKKAKKILNWNPEYSDIKTIIKTMWELYKK